MSIDVSAQPELTQRFWSRCAPAADGCLMWTGALTEWGYGRFHFDYHSVYAHRFAYEAINGPIADGLTIDHLCRNKACVNPNHLEAVTTQVNTIRHTSSITRCPAGHGYSEENTRMDRRGKRHCRACDRTRKRESSAALSGEAGAR